MIKVHMVSETEWITQGAGVHTAFIELIDLLKTDPSVHVVVNNQGTGDIFHSHTYGPYYFWKGWRYKGRRILTAHVIPDSSRGTIPFWKKLMPLTKAYLKMAYAYADVVIAISPTVEEEIEKLGAGCEIVRIYNPVVPDNWARTSQNRTIGRELLKLGIDDKVVLGVGQLQERKGVEDFIDMAVAMPEYQFVWVGGRPMGPFTEGIKRINQRIDQAPANLQFTGLLDLKAMPPMYAAADVFLFPSYQENCPMAPLEAAASGLPVVFRDIPEYASLYQTEYLKAKSTSEFITTTQKLFGDPKFQQFAIDLSRELIKEFDKEKIKNSLVQLYRRMLTRVQQGHSST